MIIVGWLQIRIKHQVNNIDESQWSLILLLGVKLIELLASNFLILIFIHGLKYDRCLMMVVSWLLMLCSELLKEVVEFILGKEAVFVCIIFIKEALNLLLQNFIMIFLVTYCLSLIGLYPLSYSLVPLFFLLLLLMPLITSYLALVGACPHLSFIQKLNLSRNYLNYQYILSLQQLKRYFVLLVQKITIFQQIMIIKSIFFLPIKIIKIHMSKAYFFSKDYKESIMITSEIKLHLFFAHFINESIMMDQQDHEFLTSLMQK